MKRRPGLSGLLAFERLPDRRSGIGEPQEPWAVVAYGRWQVSYQKRRKRTKPGPSHSLWCTHQHAFAISCTRHLAHVLS